MCTVNYQIILIKMRYKAQIIFPLSYSLLALLAFDFLARNIFICLGWSNLPCPIVGEDSNKAIPKDCSISEGIIFDANSSSTIKRNIRKASCVKTDHKLSQLVRLVPNYLSDLVTINPDNSMLNLS